MARRHSVAVIVVILVLTAASPAAAYIDPGNTSMLVQLVVGSVAAGLVLSRRLWRGALDRLTGLFRSVSSSDPAAGRRSGP